MTAADPCYRIAITLTAPAAPAQASSSFAVFAPGADQPFAYTACQFGDADGAVAEAAGRAAADRHAQRRDPTATTAPVIATRTVIAATAPAVDSPALHALVALTDELDRLAAHVKRGYPDEVTCRKGCDACCHQQVGISRVEAERVAATIAGLAPAARAALAATVRRATTSEAGVPPIDVCGALDADGACQIYAGRPVVCRSHGLIYGYRTPTPSGWSAPGYVRSCGLNFRHQAPVPLLRTKPPAQPDRSYVHDSDAGSTRLLAIDRAFVDEIGVAAAPVLDRSITLNALFVRLV